MQDRGQRGSSDGAQKWVGYARRAERRMLSEAASQCVLALHTPERGQDVFDRIFRVLGTRGHRALPKSRADRTTGEHQVIVDSSSPEWLTLLMPPNFVDGFGCAQRLSAEFECYAFDFVAYCAETWWYNLFDAGHLIDLFWQHPRFFEGRHPDEPAVEPGALEARRGQPDLLAQLFDVPMELLQPYFEQIDDQPFRHLKQVDPAAYSDEVQTRRFTRGGRAHDGDRYALHDPMNFVDLALKVGIRYPSGATTQPGLRFFALRPAGEAETRVLNPA
mgnify:CR=1 FL=1